MELDLNLQPLGLHSAADSQELGRKFSCRKQGQSFLICHLCSFLLELLQQGLPLRSEILFTSPVKMALGTLFCFLSSALHCSLVDHVPKIEYI